MGEVNALSDVDSSGIKAKLSLFLNWARQWSMWQYPFVTACCGMEFMSLFGPRYDLARFGAEALTGTPRPSDLLWIVGTISQRQAPVLKQIYEQMGEPKWVIAVGTCACTGGFYDNYATLPGADKVVPVDIYVPGCPPRPEAIIDGFMLLQEKVLNNNRIPATVPPHRLVPPANNLRKTPG
jgi:NADH-quinone oxidoreductase subunit B